MTSYELSICIDCMLDQANGECGNESEHGCNDRDSSGRPVGWPDWSGHDLALGCGCEDYDRCCCDDGWFSWSSCDWCGSTLGGQRYAAAAFSRSEDGL